MNDIMNLTPATHCALLVQLLGRLENICSQQLRGKDRHNALTDIASMKRSVPVIKAALKPMAEAE